ncbi:MAG: beta-lactamase family protein, partial [Rhodobacteraceae bacterium]|nr:beta-lactamase family protein [Paracoccaceae bacterium]
MSKNLLHAALVGVVMTSGPAQSADLERADPASVGMSAAALANLKTKMNELVTSGDRAGLVYAVARDGKTVALEAIGLRSIENQLPMETDTQFRIYSMTRAISATAALSLLDDGALALEDNVERYIPEIGTMKVIDRSGETISTVDQASPMTVRHLFTYTAGLGYAPNWPAPYTFDQKTVLNPDVTIAEGVANLAKFPLLYQPGAKWHYGFSGDVLGRVAEVASGQPLDQLIKARVLDKIGMTGTGFWISPDDVKRNRLADVYARKEENGPLVNGNSNVPPLSHFTRPGKLFSGGGGLVSTVPDYLRFAQ